MVVSGKIVGTLGVSCLSVLLGSLMVIAIYLATATWPPDCVNNQCSPSAITLFFWSVTLSHPASLFLLVAVSGALGALIHVMSSFADYVGNRQLVESWVWWLFLRIPIGSALAIVFYLLIRGGLVIPNGSTEPQVNPYGASGLAALVGMFAKQATDKLAEIFDTLFRSERQKRRSEPLVELGTPDVIGLEPDSVPAGTKNVMVRIDGGPFAASAAVRVDGKHIKPVSAHKRELQVTLPDELISSPKQLKIVAINPGHSGGVSEPVTLSVTEV
jgi:hypothetical protein